MTAIERAERYLREDLRGTSPFDIIRALIAETRELTGRKYPKRCQCCGQIREATESLCGQCGCELEGPCE